jgi:hypothetical protein
MWTYRIDDGDDSIITTTRTMSFDSELEAHTEEDAVASGTVYVVMDSNGRDWAWVPVTVNKLALHKFCEVMNQR